MTGSAKTGLIAHDRKFNFLSQTQGHIDTPSSFTAKKKVMGGLLLQAASSQPISDPYKRSGSIMEHWCEGRGLGVTVKLRGAE